MIPAPGGAPAAHILVVEDEPLLAEAIREFLAGSGYRVSVVRAGDEAVREAQQSPPDLVILDLMLPGLDGLEVCRRLRAVSDVPIIILTARNQEADRVLGFEGGADQYVAKPVGMYELLVRVRAALRREARTPHTKIVGGEVVIERTARRAWVRGREVALTQVEFALLEALLRRAGQVSSRRDLLHEVWGPQFFGDDKTLDVHIHRLRSKIERDPAHPVLIETVRGVGYRLEVPS